VDTAAQISVGDLVRAGRVLFGRSFAPDGAGWRVALRDVYRRRALETHPDRARALGRPEAELAREFHAVTEAYRVLAAVAVGPCALGGGGRRATERPHGSVSPPRTAPRPAAAPRAARHEAAARETAARQARAARAPLPRRRLRLAEYLYYTGRIPWSAFVAAIAWQRAQRPQLSRIAVDLGFLAQADVAAILASRRAEGAMHEPFGEYALRRGFLTRLELLTALGRQGRHQRRIGEYFAESGLLDAGMLDEAHAELFSHNARFR